MRDTRRDTNIERQHRETHNRENTQTDRQRHTNIEGHKTRETQQRDNN